MNDRIRELDLFLCVAEEASFSSAARKLDVAPSTISKAIRRLEKRLGARLFHRTSRVLQLTQEGERVWTGARDVAEALEEVEQAFAPARGQATGVLRVNSTPAFARHHLAPIVPEFLARHPRLKVEFMLTVTPPDILDQQIDLSIQSAPVPSPTLVAKRITVTRWIICASPAYLEKAGVPRTMDDLRRHNCLNFMPGSYRSQWPLNGVEKAGMVKAEGNAAANNGDMLCALACLGLGIVRLADHHVSAALVDGLLVPVLEDLQSEAVEPVFAVYANRRTPSRRVKAFLDFLDEQFAGVR